MREKEECRLTYKEGKEISTKAGRPYMMAAICALVPCSMIAVLTLATGLMDGTLLNRAPDLDVLLAQGEVSQPVYDYLNRNIHGFGPVLAGTLFGSFSTCFAMIVLADSARREALKKANEEKKPRGYRTEEEHRCLRKEEKSLPVRPS